MKRRYTPEIITTLKDNEIFVFGSNLQGQHLGGAARIARQWGAIMGQGEGIQGQTYAIPTMFKSVEEIAPYVENFILYAKENPNNTFFVTKIGCGIAGFKIEQIAPLFKAVIEQELPNVILPKEFWELLTS